jgi:probable rRNA maturation factor
VTAGPPDEPFPVELQIAIEEGNWAYEEPLTALCRKVIGAASRYLVSEEGQPMPPDQPELSLLFTDDASMREINGEWRDQDKPTNVLSFPGSDIEPGDMPGPMLGDIVFAEETIGREAEYLGIAFDDHLAHLIVHGYLHLFGYDHVEPGEAGEMETLETRILATLGISDPYGHTEPV